MLVRPTGGSDKKPFRIVQEPTLFDNMVTYFQVLFIFLVVRLVMVLTGVTLIPIPFLDPLLRKLINYMRIWFE